jgi:hypothetical protein
MTVKRPESSNECDHDWIEVDDSFDHEYGTEQIFYYVCAKCDATKEREPDDLADYDN